MKCEKCRSERGREVDMMDLGVGQHQCPDCRAVVVPPPLGEWVPSDEPSVLGAGGGLSEPPTVEPRAVLKLLTNVSETETSYVFNCPGCENYHSVRVVNNTGEPKPIWSWNGSVDKPTFQPSILQKIEYGDGRPDSVCHSYVTDGRIQFLADSTHAKAGQVLDLPECDW